MNLTFRDACATDDCRHMVYSSGTELYDYMYATKTAPATDYIAREFASGRGFAGHRIHTVAVVDGQVAAVGAFYVREQVASMLVGTVGQVVRHYGPVRAVPVLRSAMHAGSVLRTPRPGQVYIANLGVRADMRGRGIGAALIEHEAAKARTSGKEAMTLDVATNNPRAESLYKRLGFEVVQHKQFKGRPGSGVPNCKFMLRPITT